MADKYAGDCTKTMHHYGVGVRTDPTVPIMQRRGIAGAEDTGRPDQMCLVNGYGWYIGIKWGRMSYKFDQLSENQRNYIDNHATPNRIETWVWLSMGEHPPNRSPDKYNPRKGWLIPYPALLKIEDLISPVQKSLPYLAGKGIRKELQENKWDAIHLLPRWELEWHKGQFYVPKPHSFYKRFLAQTKHLYGGAFDV